MAAESLGCGDVSHRSRRRHTPTERPQDAGGFLPGPCSTIRPRLGGKCCRRASPAHHDGVTRPRCSRALPCRRPHRCSATTVATRKDSVRCADFCDELSPYMVREDVPPVPAACGPPAPRLPLTPAAFVPSLAARRPRERPWLSDGSRRALLWFGRVPLGPWGLPLPSAGHCVPALSDAGRQGGCSVPSFCRQAPLGPGPSLPPEHPP